MSFDEELPTDKDIVRAYLGDTNDAAELVTDAHIEAVLRLQGTVAGAVVFLARQFLARFANRPARVTLPNGLSVSYDRSGWQALVAGGVAGILGGTGAAFSVQPRRYDGYAALEDEG